MKSLKGDQCNRSLIWAFPLKFIAHVARHSRRGHKGTRRAHAPPWGVSTRTSPSSWEEKNCANRPPRAQEGGLAATHGPSQGLGRCGDQGAEGTPNSHCDGVSALSFSWPRILLTLPKPDEATALPSAGTSPTTGSLCRRLRGPCPVPPAGKEGRRRDAQPSTRSAGPGLPAGVGAEA